MPRTRWSTLPVLALTLAGPGTNARADGPDAGSGAIAVGDFLVLPRAGGGRAGRSPVQPDPVALDLVKGRFVPPEAGDEVKAADGRSTRWEASKAGDDRPPGVRRPAVGYAFASVPSATDRVLVLEASGHSLVFVNGEPRAGDVYGYGYVKLPVRLKAGDNSLLFQGGRGQLKAALVPPRNADGLQVETGDPTLPDLVAGRAAETWGALVVLNANETAGPAAEIRAAVDGGPEVMTKLPTLPPLSTRKVGFRIEAPAFEGEGKKDLRVKLVGADGGVIDEAKVELRVRRPGQSRRQTFLSGIDGSVQYFGLVPASPSPDDDPKAGKPGLILTLHGASVEGQGQADVYAPRPWAHVVAPTNRRPYGFDWEDWGRLDAIEVLDLAAKQLDHDPGRVYLTGHSMGGHGAWHLGVTFPDRFAAVAPSAGWVSMASYAGARPVEGTNAVAGLLGRPTLPSDTLALVSNLTGLGVYVLHGSADTNVSVEQARRMRQQLGGFHRDFVYYEKPGAEHWWGNECCDWPPLMDFLRRHEIPARKDVPRVDFLTAHPGVSARAHWATVEAQERAFRPSAVHLAYDKKARRFSGTTENVARLALDLGHVEAGGPVTVEVDGTTVENVERPDGGEPRVWLEKAKGAWSVVPRPTAALKGPHRSGPFKDAFRNRVVFVYGTRGTAAENAWALAKARFDSERFWYQGNASVDVVPDSAFDPAAEPDRNVVLYGHADGNAAWDALLGKAPVRVRRGSLEVGGKSREADDLACLFVAPRPGSDLATVGAVCGTGLDGLRLTDKLPYFTSGVEYPDLVVLSPSALEKGAEGVVAAGFFGNDWGVDSGEFAWAD